jgi:hypothetical protein
MSSALADGDGDGVELSAEGDDADALQAMRPIRVRRLSGSIFNRILAMLILGGIVLLSE